MELEMKKAEEYGEKRGRHAPDGPLIRPAATFSPEKGEKGRQAPALAFPSPARRGRVARQGRERASFLRRSRKLFCLLSSVLCLLSLESYGASAPAQAPANPAEPANPASALARDGPGDMPDTLREQLDTIGRYAEEVQRRVGAPEAATPAETAAPEASTPEANPPEEAAAPARGARQIDLTVDPFGVSPQLRAGAGARFSGLPDASMLELQRRVQVRAVLRTSQGVLAQLLINNKDVITLMDKDLIDLGDLGIFQAEIQTGAVALSNPNNPQGKKVVLR
jgi:hypothetical protein